LFLLPSWSESSPNALKLKLISTVRVIDQGVSRIRRLR